MFGAQGIVVSCRICCPLWGGVRELTYQLNNRLQDGLYQVQGTRVQVEKVSVDFQ